MTTAIADLKIGLGDFLSRQRPDGIIEFSLGGPGSVAALADLDVPEIHLDLLPGPLTREQRQALAKLGYQPEGENWRHPNGLRVVVADHDSGWRTYQSALRSLLSTDEQAAAQYRTIFHAQGREAADRALMPAAMACYAETVGFQPVKDVTKRLRGLNVPWMVAAGVALDLHIATVTRPHDDLDLLFSYNAQTVVREIFREWRLDAAIDSMYAEWLAPLEPPHFQVHARHSGFPMVDLMFSDLSGDLWRYRRNPRITLPLSEARMVTSEGIPYLAPHAALLYKAPRPGQQARFKDQQDFERILPLLTATEREWLLASLEILDSRNPWLNYLRSTYR